MSTQYTRLLQFSRQFGKFYAYQFAPFLERTGLSMREVHVLLFLANNPECDTARDVSEYRGISKSQVSQAVELLAAGTRRTAGWSIFPSQRTALPWPGSARKFRQPAASGC